MEISFNGSMLTLHTLQNIGIPLFINLSFNLSMWAGVTSILPHRNQNIANLNFNIIIIKHYCQCFNNHINKTVRKIIFYTSPTQIINDSNLYFNYQTQSLDQSIIYYSCLILLIYIIQYIDLLQIINKSIINLDYDNN